MASVTSEQRTAASNLAKIAGANAQNVKDQFSRAMANLDRADLQNKRLADVQFRQNSEKNAEDRFAQAKKLQTSASSLMSSAGNGMQGSGLGNLIGMLDTRLDLDNGEALGTLKANQDAVRNSLNESLNENQLERNREAKDAQFQLGSIESDTAAQLNTINPNLFVTPGHGKADLGADGFAKARIKPARKQTSTGYITPASDKNESKPTVLQGESYFDRMLNSYNNRKG